MNVVLWVPLVATAFALAIGACGMGFTAFAYPASFDVCSLRSLSASSKNSWNDCMVHVFTGFCFQMVICVANSPVFLSTPSNALMTVSSSMGLCPAFAKRCTLSVRFHNL